MLQENCLLVTKDDSQQQIPVHIIKNKVNVQTSSDIGILGNSLIMAAIVLASSLQLNSEHSLKVWLS